MQSRTHTSANRCLLLFSLTSAWQATIGNWLRQSMEFRISIIVASLISITNKRHGFCLWTSNANQFRSIGDKFHIQPTFTKTADQRYVGEQSRTEKNFNLPQNRPIYLMIERMLIDRYGFARCFDEKCNYFQNKWLNEFLANFSSGFNSSGANFLRMDVSTVFLSVKTSTFFIYFMKMIIFNCIIMGGGTENFITAGETFLPHY